MDSGYYKNIFDLTEIQEPPPIYLIPREEVKTIWVSIWNLMLGNFD